MFDGNSYRFGLRRIPQYFATASEPGKDDRYRLAGNKAGKSLLPPGHYPDKVCQLPDPLHKENSVLLASNNSSILRLANANVSHLDSLFESHQAMVTNIHKIPGPIFRLNALPRPSVAIKAKAGSGPPSTPNIVRS
jgi:hypothetical protein